MEAIYASPARWLVAFLEQRPFWWLTFVELLLVITVVTATVARTVFQKPGGQSKAPGFRSVERLFRRPTRRAASIVSVGVLAVVLRFALIPILGVPLPSGHDEFSYLLAADTFAHGRLTNPTHPMWAHFESFHIIHNPTYMSQYPPVQGLVLAPGVRVGYPWICQWIVTALMCSVFCWMLQAWVPPRWALLGGLLAVLRLGVMSYWMNTYWAGAIVALGGALVIGAWPRLKKRARVRHAIIMAVGLVILANSRPYEGLIFSLPIAAAMLAWLLGKKRPMLKVALVQVVLPMVVVLLLASIATGYYYYRVTGSPFRMTYAVNRDTYSIAPYFLFQEPLPEPQYHHAIMREFYERDFRGYEEHRTVPGFLSYSAERFGAWWRFYLGPALTLPLLALPWLIRNRKMRLPLVTIGVLAVGMAPESWSLPHYFAPAAGLLYVVVVQGMRYLRLWSWRGNSLGAALVRAIPVVCVAMILLRVTAALAHVQIEPAWPRGNLKRAHVIEELNRIPGEDLVLVRCAPNHSVDDEYVYNGANIDAQKIIWARDMDEQQNQELLRYFHGRKAWLLEVDRSPQQVQPYPEPAAPSSQK